MASGIRTALPPVPSSARGKSAAEPGRRSLLRGLAASGLVLAPTLVHAADADPPAPPADPIWSRTLGPGVDDRPYGRPSHYEKGVIRRYVPWLTAVHPIRRQLHPVAGPARHHHRQRAVLSNVIIPADLPSIRPGIGC